MKQRTVKLNLTTCPANLKRDGYALFACLNEDNKIAIGAKDKWYPKGIYRIAGGGIHKGEDPHEAGIRELKEEFQIKTTKEEFPLLVEIIVDAHTGEGDYKESFYIFTAKINSKDAIASDDIEAIAYLTKDEFNDLNKNFVEICVRDGNLNKSRDEWQDYAILFSTIQIIVGEELEAIGLW